MGTNVVEVSDDLDDFKEHLQSKCIGGKGNITESEDGEIFVSCNVQPLPSQHHFETSLYVKTDEGTYSVIGGGDSFSVQGSVESYRYGGCVSSVYGTYRCVIYKELPSIDAVVDEPKRCDPHGDFCFDIFSDVCQFYFANKVWERICPNLRVISFVVDA